jgi:hypothetical protein
MEDLALDVFVDAGHNPILMRLTDTLNQAAAVNVVPVVGELIAAGGRDFELQPGGRMPAGNNRICRCERNGLGTKAPFWTAK